MLARGAIERIGSPIGQGRRQVGQGRARAGRPIADHGDAVQLCLDQLTDPEIGVLADAGEVVGDRLQGGPRPEPDRRAPGRRARAGGDGGVRRRRPRAQSALHQGDADAPRALPAASAGRRVRDRLSPDDPRGQPALRHPRRVGDRARHPPLGLPRRQPSLHRRADARAAGPRATSRSSPATWAAARRSAPSATASRSRAAWA